ncbi:MAG: prephenate dehydratase [Planctomycetota bacterium]
MPAPIAKGQVKPSGRSLDELRVAIDDVDKRLIALLNERASLVVEVGAFKRDTNSPIYAPDREQAVLRKVLDASEGPLPPSALEAVYRELMSGSFALERPLRIGYLGPPGSFSHQAAVRQFGSSVSYEDLHEIRGVFVEVARGHCDYGLAPIENSTGGGVVETLDAFREFGTELEIYAEVHLNVHHALIANGEPKDVKRIHSKPEAFSQCRRWLSTQYPNAELIAAPSTARAVQLAKAEELLEPGRGSAAIASTLAGKLYGVNILFEDIEDDPNNLTRFFVLSKEAAKPSGKDKTSIMFNTADEPGALVKVLQVFEDAGVNLSHIDKRPSGRVNWEYTFFVDALGHRDDDTLQSVIDVMKSVCREVTVLGSYPAAQRIL